MTAATTTTVPGLIARIRSRRSGHPTGPLAFSLHTIYFMPDPTTTFTEIARVLRPGGTLVVACRPSDAPPPTWMDPAVYRNPTDAQITTVLTTAGFTRVDHRSVETTGHELELFAASLPNAARPA